MCNSGFYTSYPLIPLRAKNHFGKQDFSCLLVQCANFFVLIGICKSKSVTKNSPHDVYLYK